MLALVAAAWAISDRLTFNQTFASLNTFLLQSRLRIDQIDTQVDSALQSLNAFSAHQQQCSTPVFKELGQIVRGSEYVYDAALQMPDGKVCSSYGYELPKELVPHSATDMHYLTPDRDYWFPDAGAPNQIFIVIASQQAYVWVNKDIFFDALQTPSSIALQFVDADDLHSVLVKDTLPFALKPSVKVGQLTASEGYWYLAFTTQWPHLLGVVSLSASQVERTWWVNFLLVLLSGAVVSLGIFYTGTTVYQRHFSFASKIARAIRHNQMSLSYQPIVDLRTGQWRGAEALLRWNVKGQIISPALVIAEVERCGLICDLTRWVCQRVAEDYAAFFQYGAGQYFTINLSARDLADPQFVDFVSALFMQYNVPAAFIVFELTESVLVDKEQAASQLQRLHDLGHRIALDDFGTGYSSLSYLEYLPIDILKMDRSFITSHRYRAPDAMWRQVLGIATTLQLTVVAEGVEFAEQAELLSRAGVALAQGWLYSEALSAQQFVQLSVGGSVLKFA
ncbi:sensor c-di-GMP phosphodiesterase-like protein [Pseudomonas fluorescens]|uniref:EAL domain-containing protein n=1 Tax=Pseudomonas fluorescens TaxID=294 RepID=UPI0020A065C6|nr:sensor c-di-GMP phosphodiesterase-like protein [Pseudomonas fluorescens]